MFKKSIKLILIINNKIINSIMFNYYIHLLIIKSKRKVRGYNLVKV